MTPYSQRDAKWANIKLGNSNTSTLGQYGCLITCFGIVTDTTPDVVNQKLKDVGGFSDDLVVWANVKKALPLDVMIPVPYNNDSVVKEIEKNGFCIVKVDFDGKISTPADFHYVVYIGNQQMIDPWTGSTKSTGWYPKVVGYVQCTKTVVVDQTLKWLRGMYQERGIDLSLPEGDIRYKVQEVFDSAKLYDETKKKLTSLTSKLEEAEGEITRLNTTLTNDIKNIKDLQEQVGDLKRQISDRDTQIDKLTARVLALESQFSPESVVVLTKEEYGRLTASKTLEKYTIGELLVEVIRKVFGKR